MHMLNRVLSFRARKSAMTGKYTTSTPETCHFLSREPNVSSRENIDAPMPEILAGCYPISVTFLLFFNENTILSSFSAHDFHLHLSAHSCFYI